MATMILVEECQLRLDEPVERPLPELAGRRVLKRLDGPLDDTVPANQLLTVRDLLTFRMGFGLIMGLPAVHPMKEQKFTSGNGFIERFNNALRERVSRLVRKALSCSKKLVNPIGVVTRCICHDNLTSAAA